MFLEFSGILSFYAWPASGIGIGIGIVWRHSCVVWFCLRSEAHIPSSCWPLLNLAQLLALIWGHCHRYKTESGLFAMSVGQEASVAHFSNIQPALCGFWVRGLCSFCLIFLSECVHQHLVSREIHSRLVII